MQIIGAIGLLLCIFWFVPLSKKPKNKMSDEEAFLAFIRGENEFEENLNKYYKFEANKLLYKLAPKKPKKSKVDK